MRLGLNNGIFYEFVPFTDENFDSEGNIKPDARTMLIDEVEEGREYALLLSTCAGAWRYLIGDVIKFVSVEQSEIVITGRTKHFLSLCGEHLSVDNMNKAIELVSEELNVSVPEFTVAGIPHGSLFAHYWYVGCEQPVDAKVFRDLLDSYLKKLNDDYAVERSAALKDIFVQILPAGVFYDYMKASGKIGGQNKFPRVVKGKQLDDWAHFVRQAPLSFSSVYPAT